MPQRKRRTRSRRRSVERPRRPGGRPRRARWLDSGTWMAIAAAAGAGLLVVAMLSGVFNRGAETFEGEAETLAEPVEVAGIEVLAPSVDLGRLPLDVTVDHVFTLRNVGQSTVRIGDARTQVLEGC